MASQSLEAAIGILRILTTGIQNLAALIPILSTELCAKHVPKALKKGHLYASAAPITIFGSLGIAKAGFIALVASIDSRFFRGPTLLKNAGFHPSGMGKLLLHVKHDKHHLYKAEDKLRAILNKKKVTEVKVNIWSWDFWWWNIRLALFTALLSSLGLIPYIIFIRVYLEDKFFLSTWIFPLARLLGSGLVVVNVQFLFQLRIIEEAYYRLRFIAADNYLKQLGKSLPTRWDPNERSKNIFTELASEWSPTNEEPLDQSGRSTFKHQLEEADEEKILDGAATLTSFDFNIGIDALPPTTTPKPSPRDTLQPTTIAATPRQSLQDTLHPSPNPTTPKSSLQETLHRRGSSASRRDTADFNAAEQGAPKHEYPPATPRVDTTASTRSRTRAKAKVILWVTRQFTTLILWGTQAFLLLGILLTVLGYIGCATVVGSSTSSKWKGPLVWLACEALLSGVRTAIWAYNPPWDEPRFLIVLEKSNGTKKLNGSQTDGTQPPGNSSSYGIGWALDSPTADDMHALLIGVNNCNTTDFEDLDKAKSDAQSVAKYLQDTLLVPPSQIRTLYDTDATRSRIVEELKSLRHRGSVTPDAPIVIYYAGHSFVADESTYLVPHLPSGDKLLRGEPKDYCLPYAEIVDLLRHVADEKTDNIVLILDSCHAGAMGQNPRFNSQPNSPHSGSGLTSKRPSQSKRPSVLPRPVEEKPVQGQLLGSDLLPSISRISDNEGETSMRLSGLPLSSEKTNEGLAELDSELRQVNGNDARYRSNRKRPKKVTNATTEILIGHSSHLLLAGADASQQAYEDPVSGGRFTQTLLDVLRDAGKEGGDLQTMTYKELVERIKKRFGEIEADPQTKRSLLHYQTALCTTIYQDRHLFDGLFTRKVDNSSAKPVIRVLYSD